MKEKIQQKKTEVFLYFFVQQLLRQMLITQALTQETKKVVKSLSAHAVVLAPPPLWKMCVDPQRHLLFRPQTCHSDFVLKMSAFLNTCTHVGKLCDQLDPDFFFLTDRGTVWEVNWRVSGENDQIFTGERLKETTACADRWFFLKVR